ncbi:SAM-dependent methyltransferase [Natronobacillus azotifigens]|uniref:Class I SAM-dependent methyltransferase n=1 Tax=Natronobacillus azotifigens TaxID=472978 RepID=A0A9J6RCV3_9BACI|nr:class I SAM-dependent methyltransferase [Natronobacillus azotifigens]MCZ0703179.1 class I SAM-dependent methyltransferase [Natronobacillus azotifigens]
MHEAGHTFLAKLGKTRLRPGGIQATDWLFDHVDFSSDMSVLEVACNQCTNAIELVRKTGCSITAVDLDAKVIDIAKDRVAKAGLTEKIHVEQANALNLPYQDNSFDLVINEAMLTMLGDKQKTKAVSEYYRVLKPEGMLLTHDVRLTSAKARAVVTGLQKAIHVPAKPYDERGWKELFVRANFVELDVLTGPMSLMNPIGMIRDEGLFSTMKIFRNGMMKSENRPYFKQMFRFFQSNKKDLGFIAIVGIK